MQPAGADLDTRKAALRQRMRALRVELPDGDRDLAGRRIAETVLALPPVVAARTALVFSSFGSEVQTGAILRGLFASGTRVLLPFLEGGVMETAEMEAGEELVPTSYGPLEPAGRVAADPAIVDVVIAPGLAFDRRGNRLGYGAGHYDGYLRRIRGTVPRIGIGFSVQVVDEVPAGPGDERLDLLVTEDGVIECSPSRAG